jgi:hypothetical protein
MPKLDRHTFNVAILGLAPVHLAQALAPSTFAEVMRSPSLVVWEGASDATIFRDARVNHAFRAWHDSLHIAGAHDFTLTGEIATMKAQCAALREAFPSAPQWAFDILRAEVQGQAEYFAAHGTFPANQIAFTLEAANVQD